MVPNYLFPERKMMFIASALGIIFRKKEKKRSKCFGKKKACFLPLKNIPPETNI